MRRRLFGRALQVIPTLILVSIIVFGLQQLMPGDPASVMAGEERGDAALMAQIRAEMFLDRSLPEQYVHWIGRIAHGDLGYSFRIRAPITSLIAPKTAGHRPARPDGVAIAVGIGVPTGSSR